MEHDVVTDRLNSFIGENQQCQKSLQLAGVQIVKSVKDIKHV